MDNDQIFDEQDEALNSDALNNLARLEDEASAMAAEANAIEEGLQDDKASAAMSEADRVAAEQGAMMAVGFMESLVKMRFPMVQYTDEQKLQVRDKITPVMMKHGAGLPEWLQPYREEIELGVCLGTMAFSTYVQVKQFELEQLRMAQEEADRKKADVQQEAA